MMIGRESFGTDFALVVMHRGRNSEYFGVGTEKKLVVRNISSVLQIGHLVWLFCREEAPEHLKKRHQLAKGESAQAGSPFVVDVELNNLPVYQYDTIAALGCSNLIRFASVLRKSTSSQHGLAKESKKMRAKRFPPKIAGFENNFRC